MPVHVDEFGTAFTATFVTKTTTPGKPCDVTTKPFDLTGSNVVFLFRLPDNTVVEKGATILHAKKGQARYLAEADFLSLPGLWTWQARVEAPTGTWWGEESTVNVNSHLIAT